ncbi:hypothetical protein HanIR_Chr09g0408101 [Helianthus annuus]|nr:hypothetical protein HanIR_Chr09g0408101 [Helianthus annuus]
MTETQTIIDEECIPMKYDKTPVKIRDFRMSICIWSGVSRTCFKFYVCFYTRFCFPVVAGITGLGGSLTRDQKRISVGDCILKRHCSGINQRLTIVNKAVIATETFKKARVYESCRAAEPSTRHMETGYVTAATGANICDLHRVSRDAIRQKRSRTLVDHKDLACERECNRVRTTAYRLVKLKIINFNVCLLMLLSTSG